MSTFDKRLFGKRLKEMREKAGYARQIDLAAKIGTVVTTISNYEAGKRLPDAEMLSRIVEVLPCNADYLLGFEDKPSYSHSFITKETGLSENTVERLCNIASNSMDPFSQATPVLKALNAILENNSGVKMLSQIYYYLFENGAIIAAKQGVSEKEYITDNTFSLETRDVSGHYLQVFSGNEFIRMLQNSRIAEIQEMLLRVREEIQQEH